MELQFILALLGVAALFSLSELSRRLPLRRTDPVSFSHNETIHFRVVTNTTPITESARLLFDSSSPPSSYMLNFKDVQRWIGVDDKDEVWAKSLGVADAVVTAWKASSTQLRNRTEKSILSPTRRGVTYDREVGLAIPCRAISAPKSFAILESLRYTLDTPIDIVLATGAWTHEANATGRFLAALRLVNELYGPEVDLQGQKVYPRIRWYVYRTPLDGALSARWLAAHSLHTKYVIFMDSDDWLTYGSITSRISYLRKVPLADVLLKTYELANLNHPGHALDSWVNHSFPPPEAVTIDDARRLVEEELVKTMNEISWEKAYKEYVMDDWPVSHSMLYQMGSVVGWIGMQVMDDHWREEVERLVNIHLKPEDVARENREKQWLDGAKTLVKLEPLYVFACANGWSAAKRDVWTQFPVPVTLGRGEDAVLNYVMSMAGIRVVCVPRVDSLYSSWGPVAMKEILAIEI